MLGRLEGKRRVQANINEPNAEGNTPLHLVAQSTASVEVREELVSLLLRYGAQPGTIDKFGKMPQECVEQSSAVFKKLNKALSTQCKWLSLTSVSVVLISSRSSEKLKVFIVDRRTRCTHSVSLFLQQSSFFLNFFFFLSFLRKC